MVKKILFVINADWFFVSHFLPVGLEAVKRGYEVHIACDVTNKKEYLENLGFLVHPLLITRSGRNIKTELITIFQIYKTIKRINPFLIEFFTIKPNLYGGIVSKFFPIRKKIFYITGLGYIFMSRGLKGFIVKTLIKKFYKFAISGKTSLVITENYHDKELMYSLNALKQNQIKIIKGAGVNLSHYEYIGEDNKNLKVVMACRLLKDKGVFEFTEAAKILKAKYKEVEFDLYGDIDPGNPTSLTENDIDNIKKEGFVKVKGFSSDIAQIFAISNIIVLPSYREGMPKVLIEAAACGRAIVTSDVPGCKEAIVPNQTGLLCKPRNIFSLSLAIEKLILDKNLRNKMGQAGRILAEKEYDVENIVAKHFKLYEDA